MMALAELALEILYIRALLTSLGHMFNEEDEPEIATDGKMTEARRRIHEVGEIVHGPTEANVDNSGAYSLCQRATNGKNSRHVDRKVYKMRELRREGKVKMKQVPTDEMRADMMTKSLDDKLFRIHRAACMSSQVEHKTRGDDAVNRRVARGD